MNEVLSRYDELTSGVKQRLESRKEHEKVRVQIGSATCENAAGADAVCLAFERAIEASGRDDVVIKRVGCTGRCGQEPIVGVYIPGEMPVQYEAVVPEKAHRIFVEHIQRGQPFVEREDKSTGPAPSYELIFCRSARCDHLRHRDLGDLMRERLEKAGVPHEKARVIDANCFGLCKHDTDGPVGHVLLRPDRVVYKIEGDSDVDEIIDRQINRGETVERLKVDQAPLSERFFQLYGGASFLYRQSRIALRNSGLIDPGDFDEYVHFNGFEAIARALAEGDPEAVIDMIRRSKLRGRGGAGYPTALKWSFARKSEADQKYVICNADEGDPGAFMDRSMLEGDPFSIIEGMMIAGFAIGASRGFFYIRAEYPLAVERIEKAIDACRAHGLLGKDILGSGFDFDLEVRLGAGAFVCGEETALIHSIEGHRGQPRIRPPYPTDFGLWGKPTIINNVETLGNVPAIVLYGPEWFASVGTESSGGTKVFALTGKVVNTGLVEVPMGTSLREIVYDIGGGVAEGKQLKAVQTGGPAGGCIPVSAIDTPVDFDSLSKVGAIMGSGGMIVMDESDCMVDISRFFMAFSQDESCGKCTPCREGTTRMLEILDRIATGQGELEDLDKLKRLGKLVVQSSLCGLGRAAPNPILSTLTHFSDEYLAHVTGRVCPSGRCPMKVETPKEAAAVSTPASEPAPLIGEGEREARSPLGAAGLGGAAAAAPPGDGDGKRRAAREADRAEQAEEAPQR